MHTLSRTSIINCNFSFNTVCFKLGVKIREEKNCQKKRKACDLTIFSKKNWNFYMLINEILFRNKKSSIYHT